MAEGELLDEATTGRRIRFAALWNSGVAVDASLSPTCFGVLGCGVLL